jgi:alginate O-acetyltransferase complex protein AlgJ
MRDQQPAENSRRISLRHARARPRRPSETYHKPAGEPPARSGRWQDNTLIVLFIIAISAPLIAMLLRFDSGFVLEENRALSSRPSLSLNRQSLSEFPAKFEAYFNDQFGFRRRLIHWQNLTKVAALGVAPSPKVVLGRNDWLFYGDIELDYYRALRPFTPKQLEKWRHLLESRRDWLTARGIRYLVVIPPNKSTIYPEHMPSVYNKVEPRHLKANSQLSVVDLRDPLVRAKEQGRVYYRTDTHWNNRGAYAGYAAIIDGLAPWFPALKATPMSAFPEVPYHEPGRDLSLIMAMRDYYKDDFFDLQIGKPKLAHAVHETAKATDPPPKPWRSGENFVFEQHNPALPRAVMFRDSFCTWLIPLLPDQFQRIVFCWQYIFDDELVARERPDVVIQEFVERTLMDDVLPYQ